MTNSSRCPISSKRFRLRTIARSAWVLILTSLLLAAPCRAYQNPLILPNSEGGEEGDPFILKFNGVYYLYTSTTSDQVGPRVWTSTDLVTWAYQGACTTESVTLQAYAPEVVYSNGKFYMYTSPGGNGHYVLASSSPLGPFTLISGNVGLGIDGDVFIDDDGTWYFYHSGGTGIVANRMSSPASFGPDIATGSNMADRWTEGSTTFKRLGRYYMTYTGNHGWNHAYRIDYAVSNTPSNAFVPVKQQNPLLIRTEGPRPAVGHNGVIIGPDLDSYYVSYHHQALPGRRIDLDSMFWNGQRMVVGGPTTSSQPDPARPVFEDRWDRSLIGANWMFLAGGTWSISSGSLVQSNVIAQSPILLSAPATTANYTVEINLRRMDTGSGYGAIFSYADANNYGRVSLNGQTNQIEISGLVNGVAFPASTASLIAGFDHSSWHVLRIEKSGSTFRFYVDQLLRATRVIDQLGGGRIGCTTSQTRAQFGYVAFNNQVDGSSAWTAFKPVPGTIEAVHFLPEGDGQTVDTTPGNSSGGYRTGNVDIRSGPDNDFVVTNIAAGERLGYAVNVSATGLYDVDLRVASASDGGRLVLWDGAQAVTKEIAVPATGGTDTWQTVTIRNVPLTAGQRDLGIEFHGGGFDISRLKITNSVTVQPFSSTFDSSAVGWSRFDGTWNVANGFYQVNATGGFGKVARGDPGWGDYVVEADIKLLKAGGDAGIIVRVNNPADGTAYVSSPDYFQGYYCSVSSGSVRLKKYNFGSSQLAASAAPIATNTWNHMKVIVNGSRIRIFVGDMSTPRIDFTDTQGNAFTNGKVGLRAQSTDAAFDNVSVTANQDPTIHPVLESQADGVRLRWQSEAGAKYRVNRSVDLLNWEKLGQLYNGTGGELQYNEGFESGRNGMFYTIEFVP
jgi:hypothetical protein